MTRLTVDFSEPIGGNLFFNSMPLPISALMLQVRYFQPSPSEVGDDIRSISKEVLQGVRR